MNPALISCYATKVLVLDPDLSKDDCSNIASLIRLLSDMLAESNFAATATFKFRAVPVQRAWAVTVVPHNTKYDTANGLLALSLVTFFGPAKKVTRVLQRTEALDHCPYSPPTPPATTHPIKTWIPAFAGMTA
ncbi:hypothetical protein [Luteimonas cucumeris]|uniref:hypothetical protein n=1 Tax=Luteimonas cucumeris TaxID=985012 RepID=UPI0011A278A3|nr:hypothetical protein [Luteimonas cucumeris]